MTALEEGCGASENKIHVPFYIAVFEVLPPVIQQDRVLPPQKPAMAEYRAIAVDANR